MPRDTFAANLRGHDLRFTTQPGVFSYGEIDEGTRLLVEAMRVSPTARVLDLGCGYGVIGIVAAKLASRGHVTLIDSDIRATRLTERNLEANGIENADVILGDGVRDLPPKSRFDVVVSNPPTHSGRDVLDEMVEGAYKVLRPRGQLYLVINRLLSLRKKVEEVFGNSETIGREKGFVVIRAVKVHKADLREEMP
ncbi:MAG TPA: class I SAM-dependent methyltransferase [Dehalococcoidia bacterium]|nr:class I SAM-dependent methyltransferase [Dehalococcoidia bacterium]